MRWLLLSKFVMVPFFTFYTGNDPLRNTCSGSLMCVDLFTNTITTLAGGQWEVDLFVLTFSS
ncbi:hypothetical protein PJI17_32220, partial [Mycobacterium kansasii]